MTLTRLDLQYDAAVRRVWTSVRGRVGKSWTDLGSWRGSNVAAFQRQSLPILKGGQRQVASLTATYLEQLYRDIADDSSRVELDFDKVSGAAIRNGTEPEDVYERPFKEVWTALSNGEDLDAALDRGANRLDNLLQTDLQLTRTHAAREIALLQPAVTYTIREPIGERNCALCLIASTQRYRKKDLLPIHPGCDCLVKTVTADYDPGQVIDEEKLEAIHRAVDDALGQHDRGGRAVDYRQIVVQHEHGEIGPVLSFQGHKFTGPEDIKDNGGTDTPPAPKIHEPTASVSDATRARLGEVRAELPRSREEWLNERRKIVEPGGRLVDKRLAEEEAKLAELRAEREKLIASVEAEFKQKRTPKAKRAELMDDATWRVENELKNQERFIAELRETASKTLTDSTPQSERYMLTVTPPRYEYVYPTDQNGRKLPPDAYSSRLDSMLEVGHALRDDIRTANQSDSELARLRSELDALKASAADAASAEMRDARRAVARREAGIIHALLRDVREMGGSTPTQLGDHASLGNDLNGAPSDWERQLREAFRHFPAAWHELTSDEVLHVVGKDRAHYSAGLNGRTDYVALSTRIVETYSGAFESEATEIATHELGHRMEQYVPGLKELEFALVRRRAMNGGNLDAPENMADIYSWYKREDNEFTYKDSWADAYTGKTYEAYYTQDPAGAPSEAFQVGLQDLFGRGAKRYGDPELQAFVLSILAML